MIFFGVIVYISFHFEGSFLRICEKEVRINGKEGEGLSI